MSAERPGPTPEDETTREVSATNNGAEASANANGKHPHMWEGPAHFLLPSFEEPLALPAEKRVDAATILKKYRPKRD